eukprot:TRINITY_DN23838_c0_g1_i1.p1 TRINITY_DN23838_c0_g1~~TRINITY_DN23838_c0_g1_i1.p1  ORF type:complete len:114 (-),score=5.50 TRINITY_DN23838_c0_g1_i1:30-371(-)
MSGTVVIGTVISFFFNETATTEIYTLHIVGSVRCVQETGAVQLTGLHTQMAQIALLLYTVMTRVKSNHRCRNRLNDHSPSLQIGGWGEIRTHGTRERTPIFKTGTLNLALIHL